METDFITWLTSELDQRGWTNSELARRANISQSMISMIISGHKKPGNDTCIAIARAFNLPREEVYRRAGLLPPVPPETATVREMLHWFNQLSDEDQERALVIIRSLYEAQHAIKKPTPQTI